MTPRSNQQSQHLPREKIRRQIGLLRHGLAEKRNAVIYPNDELRPLTEKGRKGIRRAIKQLKQIDFIPQFIISSPLLRARQTAEEALEIFGLPTAALKLSPALRPETDTQIALRHLALLRPKNKVLWVGHEPGLGELLALLCGGVVGQGFALRKAGFAWIEAQRLIPGNARLKVFLPPDLFDA